MSDYIVPAIFAAVGFYLGGPQGAALGWTIGAWLFGPKADYGNQIFDPGAQELPRINQALRGSTVPMLFGTNRVASQVVWTKNFTTIRKESTTGSGGKAGGSGGGKGASGPTNVSYEYKWDMMFHIGMASQPFTLFGGWVNNKKMTPDSIVAISRGESNEGLFATGEITDDVSLSFDDAYFGQGQASNTDIQQQWDYFATQEPPGSRWPHTVYVGFNQLYLGSSPGVPQLSWEVGPGSAEYEFTGSELHDTDSTAPDGAAGLGVGGACFIEGLNGKTYVQMRDTTSTSGVVLQCITDGSVISITTAEIIQYLKDGSIIDPTATSGAYDPMCLSINNRDRFWLIKTTNFLGDFYISGILAEINEDGVVQVLQGDGFNLITNANDPPVSQHDIFAVGIYGEGNNSDPVLFAYESNLSGVRVACVPGYGHDGLLGGSFENSEVSIAELNGPLSPFDLFQAAGRNFPTQILHGGFFLPKSDILASGDPENRSYLYVYRAYREISEQTTTQNAQIESWDVDFPNGYLIRYEVQVENLLISLEDSGAGTVVNNDFDEITGESFTFPFEDDKRNLIDTADDDDHTAYLGPTVFKSQRHQYTWAVFWPKVYRAGTTNYPNGGDAHSSVRAFSYNAYAQRFTSLGVQSGKFCDNAQFDGNDNQEIRTIVTYWDQDENNLVLAAHYEETSTNNQMMIAGSFADFDIGGQTDVTPAYIVHTILTSTVFGLGISADIIDGYDEAAQYCEDNNIKLSVQYVREESILGIIEELLATFNCILVISGGRIRYSIQDFTLDPVRTIDNDHLVTDEGKPPVVVNKAARQDSYNKVRVNYFDRNLAYRQNQVEVSDEVDMDLTGVRLKEFQPRFVMGETLANQIAIRALWTNLYSRDAYNFKLAMKDSDLEPGDVITLVDSFHPELQGGVRCRIGLWKPLQGGEFAVTAVRELEYAMNASLAPFNQSSPGGRGSITGGIGPPLDFRGYELPAEFQLVQHQVLFGYNPSERAAGARLYISPDGVTYGVVGDIQPFNINGIFNDPLPARPTGYMEQDVIVWLSPISGFNVNTPTFVQTYDVDDVTEASRAVGAGIVIAGSEAMAMEGVTLLAQNKYRIERLYRGWGGTLPQDHSSGAYWHRHGGGVLAVDITPDKIGTTFHYKIAPYNFSGAEYTINSIVAKTWTVKDWPVTPQAITNLQFYATSATNGQSISIPSERYRAVVAGGSPVAVRWSAASRVTGFGAGGYGLGTGGYGRFERDTTTPSYRIEVMSANGFVVRSTFVNTEAFDYPRDTNSADFNGWKGNFQLRMTPYNGFGDVPISAVYSANLF